MEDGLSEGEIASSGGEEVDKKEEEEEEEAGRASKRRKVEKGVEGSRGSSSSLAAAKKKGLSKKERKYLKKQQQKKMDQEKKKQASLSSPNGQTNSRGSLQKREVEIVKRLARLCKGEPLNQPPNQLIKTVQFRKVILQILSSKSDLTQQVEGTEVLHGVHVVVAWLSLISSDLYSQSTEHFKKLKALQPQVQFLIEHPGSSRFVKMGLEAFMLQPEGEREGSSVSAGVEEKGAGSQSFSRANCLLSVEKMEENEFPSPSAVTVSGGSYFQIVPEWPEGGVLPADVSSYPMFAVDCEMVATEIGMELVRVSIVNEALECVYDTLVIPEKPVLDYKTRFSGVDEEILKDVTKRLPDVQADLKGVLPSCCILIGHSLENDLQSLRLAHPFVIDTSLLFTPSVGPRSKPSLKHVSKKLLDLDIQNESRSGHCSTEDANACMRLVQHKLREGPECLMQWIDTGCNILSELGAQGHSCGMVDKLSLVSLFGKEAMLRLRGDSDEETVAKSLEIAADLDFLFLQLHDFENFLKSSEKDNKARQAEVLATIDSNLLYLIENLPKKTILFVVCGSSNLQDVKRVGQQPSVDYRRLKEVVMAARRGMVVGVFIS